MVCISNRKAAEVIDGFGSLKQWMVTVVSVVRLFHPIQILRINMCAGETTDKHDSGNYSGLKQTNQTHHTNHFEELDQISSLNGNGDHTNHTNQSGEPWYAETLRF